MGYAEPSYASDYVLRPKWADDAVFRSYKMPPEIDTAPMLGGIMKAWGQWYAIAAGQGTAERYPVANCRGWPYDRR